MEYKRIEEFTTVVTGGTPSTAKSEYWDGGVIPWLQSGCCQDCDVDKTEKYITQEGYDNSSTRMMPLNTVMIALTGATAGKVGYLKFEACGNQSITGILPCDSINQRYLFYYLLSQREKILTDCVGGAQAHISQGYVKNIKVPVLSLSEQEKIVEVLTKLSDVISKRQGEINALDNLIKARFVEMFGNGTHEIVKASEVCDFITKGTTPPTGEITEVYEEEKVPFLKVYNLSFTGEMLFDDNPQYISKETHNGKLVRSKVYPNDVLMNIVGPPLGKFTLVTDEFDEWNINQAIAIFRAKERILPRFLLHALMQPKVLEPFIGQAVGIRQQNLSLEQCRNLQFPLPSLEEQKAFVEFAEQVDKSKVAVQINKDTTQELLIIYIFIINKYYYK